MKTTDMRSLSRDARHERRVQVIRLRASGFTYEAIAEQTGLSRTGVFNICQRHASDGAKALRDAVGGRKSGEGRRLTAEQESEVRRLICDKTPDQLKMPYALWTRGAVAELIEHRFGIHLPVRTMGLYLSRWGFTPQKPIRRAYEQSPAAVKQWLDTDYPAIAERAKAEGAEIHWGDETGLRSDDVRGRGFAPKGVRVCTLAFAESPEADLLIEAINAERQAMGNLLIGKRWSPQAWLVLVAAVRNGVDLHAVARLMRLGQVKVDHGMLVTGILRPGLAAVTIGGMTTVWIAVLTYNMYILNPQSPQNALTVFGGGLAGAVWLGSMMFRAARAEKVMVTRIVEAQGLTLATVQPRRSAAPQR